MKKLYYLLLLAVGQQATAQTNDTSTWRINPGGVATPAHWYTVAAPVTNALPTFITADHKSTMLPAISEGLSTSTINGHPAILFNGRGNYRLNLGSQLVSSSIFMVYKTKDTLQEASVWHLDRKNRAILVLSTDRAADLDPVAYMNFTDLHRAQAKVSSYIHHRDQPSATGDTWWQIGGMPASPHLPITSFTGMMPEFILYNRVLNSKERMQVASFLAIKYGITLTGMEASYRNSHGDPVWKGTAYPQYHHNVAGIARDDSSGLLQLSSSSSNQQQLFNISTDRLDANNSYLLWGDNGYPLTPSPKIPGRPTTLQRQWLFVPTLIKAVNTSINIDTRQFDIPFQPQPIFWLLADRSGKGTFDPAETELILMKNINAGIAQFNMTLQPGRQTHVSIATGSELALLTAVHAAPCHTSQRNSISIKAAGGETPYTLTVTDSRKKSQHILNHPGQTLDINDLPAGYCIITVRDISNRIASDSFYINPPDAPAITGIDPAGYQLPQSGSLQIDAARNMPPGLEYSWNGPNGLTANGSKLSTNQPGNYTLTVKRDGCSASTDFSITRQAADQFADIHVYPNPSGGDFSISVTLQKAAPLKLTIYAPDGRLIERDEQQGHRHYFFNKSLGTAGTYLLQLSSLGHNSTQQLVIVK